MSAFVFILFFLLSVGVLCLKPIQRIGFGSLIVVGWFVKMTVAVIFIFIFTNYYGNGSYITGDAYNFVHDGAILAEYAKEHPADYLQLLVGFEQVPDFSQQEILADTHIWSYGNNGDSINDNRLMIRLNSVIHLFSGGFIYTHVLIIAFLAYLGLLLIFKTLKQHVANPNFFLATLLFFPSICFWGSGITKEALLFFALGLFINGFMPLLQKFSIGKLLQTLFGIFFLLINKPHVGLVVLALSPFLAIGQFTHWAKQLRWVIPLSTVIVAVGLTYTPSKINLLDKVSYKQKDLINVAKGGIFFVTDTAFCAFDHAYLTHFNRPQNDKIQVKKTTPGTYKKFGEDEFYPFEIQAAEKQYDVYFIQAPSSSFIEVTPINYSRLQLLKAIPSGFVNTLIRPFPWDPGRALKYAAFLNNLMLIALILFTLFKLRSLTPKEKIIQTYLLVAATSILLLIGWTTPILGAIFRYKVIAELLIIIVLFISLRPLKPLNQ